MKHHTVVVRKAEKAITVTSACRPQAQAPKRSSAAAKANVNSSKTPSAHDATTCTFCSRCARDRGLNRWHKTGFDERSWLLAGYECADFTDEMGWDLGGLVNRGDTPDRFPRYDNGLRFLGCYQTGTSIEHAQLCRCFHASWHLCLSFPRRGTGHP